MNKRRQLFCILILTGITACCWASQRPDGDDMVPKRITKNGAVVPPCVRADRGLSSEDRAYAEVVEERARALISGTYNEDRYTANKLKEARRRDYASRFRNGNIIR